MKYLLGTLLAIIIANICPAPADGQPPFAFNLNIENGLPSNHVYGEIVDRNGYLWIATEKGVTQYNGYSLKTFNLTSGLPNQDVWELNEDNQGKIWLGNISDEYGYIYNDQYHKAFIKGSKNTVYPRAVKVVKDGIVFLSYYLHDTYGEVCIEKNDTIYTITRHRIIDHIEPSMAYQKILEPICLDDSSDAVICLSNAIYKIAFKQGVLKSRKIKNCDSMLSVMMTMQMATSIGQSIVCYFKKNNEVVVENIFTGDMQKIYLTKMSKNEDVQYIASDVKNKTYYIISDKNIFEFNYSDGFRYRKKYLLNDFIPRQYISGSDMTTIVWDKFWGNCIATKKNGLWIDQKVKNTFSKKTKININEYKPIGAIQNDLYLLLSNDGHSIACIDKKLNIKYYHSNEAMQIQNIAFYNADTFLLMGGTNYFFVKTTGRLIKCRKNFLDIDIYAAIVSKPSFYCIGQNGFQEIDNDFQAIHRLDFDRYRNLVYDSIRQNFWAYNLDKVFIHNKDKDTIISGTQLSHFGVEKITKIVFDNKYGNIFFNGANGITIYDPEKAVHEELFKNINLNGSFILIYHDELIVSGQFGILFSKILGKQKISAPLLYPNLKNSNYNAVYDCNILNGQVLLNTDKGLYEVSMPADSDILNNKYNGLPFNYKFIIKYEDSTNNFKSGDTIFMDQNFRRLQFDIINPFGNGKLKYVYRFSNDTAWHELNANEFTLPAKFVPGKCYKLYLKMYDDVWRSNGIEINIYILPLWWQTATGSRMVWGLSIVCILLLSMVLVYVTRRIVLESAKKRNLWMELELKAIYAQINPHFIFNSLNSALFLVKRNKMEEAFTHISNFSQLLRGYLKSSRNKLITIGEEINNLKYYIELQQTRFSEKFGYEFKIDNTIEQEKIMIPSLLIQPFVENAINHGILPKKENGHLIIEFKRSQEKNEIICIIEDDGIGRKQSGKINESRTNKDASYGDVLIKELVSIFNKYEQMNIEIGYTDKGGANTGTIVTIKIKNLHYE